MTDDEVNSGSQATTLDDQDDDSWIEWQTMESYREGDVVLTMSSADKRLFGFTRDGVWAQLLDGEEYVQPDYQPVQWTRVPQEKWADFAFG